MNTTVTLNEDERQLILDKLHQSLHNLMEYDSWRVGLEREPLFTARIAKVRVLINKLEGTK